MSEQRTIPSDEPKSVATFTILSGGAAVADSVNVLSIVVQREVNRIASATVVIQDGQASAQSFTTSNGEEFIPGKSIEIKAGYRGDEETIFKGVVIKHSIKVRRDVSMLVVECRHAAIRMTTRLGNAYFHDMTDLEVAEQLCRAHGLAITTSGTADTHEQLVQYNSTDWDYLLCRSEANGFWVVTGDDAMEIGPPDFGQEAALSVQYGATVHELDAEIDARIQYRTLSAASWNPADQEVFEGVEAATAAVPAAGNISADDLAGATANETIRLVHEAAPETELRRWADAARQKRQLGKIRGRVRIDGTADAAPGKILELTGTGERFEGKLMITGVRQQLERGNWESVLQFGETPSWFAEIFEVAQPRAAALLPPVRGLHIGIVTNLEDPAGEDRIQVRLPLVDMADDGQWMRMASPDAGSNRGIVFRPELGDEVVVGFLNNDPRHGVVLGMLFSNRNGAPIPAKNANDEKGYVSRSGMKLHFDDGKTIVTLSTPGGHEFVLDDDKKNISITDSNGNSILMDKDGISIKSVKDLKLTADVNMKMESGANAEFNGGASAKITGGASAELSAGGNTTVRGAVVQIN